MTLRTHFPRLLGQVKLLVRQIETQDGVLIFDDTVQAKPHMAENGLIAWHFLHTMARRQRHQFAKLPLSRERRVVIRDL